MAVKRKTIHNCIIWSCRRFSSNARENFLMRETGQKIWSLPRKARGLTGMLFATDETFSVVRLFIGPTSNEVVRIKIMWKFIQGITCKQFLFFVTAINILLKMWAPKYQCGRVKLDQLGAHMAPGVLKLFATLLFLYKILLLLKQIGQISSKSKTKHFN